MHTSNSLIWELLEKNQILTCMFDILRMVDPEKGILLEHNVDGRVRETAVCCTNVFDSEERCRNCTSTRAFYSNKTMVKLEYHNGAVLLIFSVPTVQDGRRIIVEMVKDISDSMTIDVKDKQRMDSVTSMINNLNQIATTDALTGLFNRRYCDEYLPKVIENCQNLSVPMCAALLDIDNFKQVNDLHGHHAGDLVLIATASSVASFVRRGSDWGARYGGEELFVCFVGVRLPMAIKILDRIRLHIEENLVLAEGSQGISVTVSGGLVELYPGETMSDMLGRCDALLYQAKRNGKNRIETTLLTDMELV